ncbi:hypothetical protein O181_063144 [Austropuccinia psidii MF-1]|uniref:Uncharacterized protein n=1 Tax=Austropuccinia psidii MF-1 TaxID=1389203 RepID=A0A9Q3ELU6_9BASI|nr:hypothetical protein [Austropuccinia psidii MF-1]
MNLSATDTIFVQLVQPHSFLISYLIVIMLLYYFPSIHLFQLFLTKKHNTIINMHPHKYHYITPCAFIYTLIQFLRTKTNGCHNRSQMKPPTSTRLLQTIHFLLKSHHLIFPMGPKINSCFLMPLLEVI